MTRLWSIYSQAKKEFHASLNPDGTKQQAAAKFLRDTTENALQYLQGKDVDQRLIHELKATLNLAEDAVTAFHAGKKRKFEQFELTETEDAIMSSQHTSPDRGRHLARRDSRRREYEPRALEQPFRGEFPGHARALDQYQYQGSTPFEDDMYARRNSVRELFPPVKEPKRRSKKSKSKESRNQPGRGHSEVPFGYNRPVDSYQPYT